MEVGVNKESRFVLVEYPGIVKNTEKMIETLGGEVNISKTYNDPSRRLELRFRPRDVYAKPACADRFQSSSVLLRIRRRKRKVGPDLTSGDDKAPAAGAERGAGEGSKGNHPGDVAGSSGEIPAQRKASVEGTSTSKSGITSAMEGSIDGPVYQGPDGYDYKGAVLGVIDSVYRFNGMADFQYLPMAKQKTDEGGGYKSLRDELILSNLESRSWLNLEAPLFLPPPIFSRLDIPMDYAYRDGPKHGPNPTLDNRPPHIIGVARQRRPQYTLFATFEGKEVPTVPFQQAIDKVKVKLKDMAKREYLTKVFEERPIWSKNALKCHTKLSSDQLKCLLPTVAYYYVTGPWRTLWVRLGYDPRTDPGSKKYQLLDFRVRQKTAAEQLLINTKRSTYRYSLPNTVQKTSSSVAVIQADTFNVDWSQSPRASKPDPAEATFRFRPGLVPPFRQMFYQFCDIEEPEIQKLVHSNDEKEEACTEADGWCVPETQKQARNILYGHLRDVVSRDIQPADHSLPEEEEEADKKSPSKKSVASGGLELDSSDSDEDEEDEDGEEDDEDDDIELPANEMETEMLEHMAPDIEDDSNAAGLDQESMTS